MNNNTIEFKLNKKEKIIIEVETPLDNATYCSDSLFILTEKTKKTIIFDDTLKYGIEILRVMLSKALNNELQLHTSIKQDIGYLYNEEIQNKSELFYEQFEGRKFWVGRNYIMWGYNYLTTWIYNNPQGKIVLEITPIYPESFGTKRNLKKISYKDWLAGYKPYFLTILTKKTTNEWLIKTTNILKQIDLNISQEKNIKNQ